MGSVVGNTNLINLPGCPVNVENLAATLVHAMTFGALPPTDSRGRPYFAYGGLIHNQCERRPHFEYGEFVTSWGDEAAQKGWCLYKMGCKGPETFANCPTVKYADGTSWAVLAGHGCIGCTTPGFWDAMGSAYDRLPAPVAYAPDVTVDQIGMVMVGGVAAMTVAHGGGSTVRQWRNRRIASRAARVPVLEGEGAVEAPVDEVADRGVPEPQMDLEPALDVQAAQDAQAPERVRVADDVDLADDAPANKEADRRVTRRARILARLGRLEPTFTDTREALPPIPAGDAEIDGDSGFSERRLADADSESASRAEAGLARR